MLIKNYKQTRDMIEQRLFIVLCYGLMLMVAVVVAVEPEKENDDDDYDDRCK